MQVRVVAALLALLAGSVSADFIQQGNHFSDTESGLDWLDVRQTQGMSFLEVDVLLAEGGELEGWRRATREEFTQLMLNIGVPYDSSPGCVPSYCDDDYDGSEPPEIEVAIGLLGDTYENYLEALPNYQGVDVLSGYSFGMLAARTSSRIDTAMVRDGDVNNIDGDPIISPFFEDLVFTDCSPNGTTTGCQDGVNAGSDGADVFRQFNYPKLGTFLVRETPVVLAEICDNGIDDDLDGDIDGDDFDCFEPIGLQVSCMHEPIYPQAGDEVTITARAMDENGDRVLADLFEIYINNISTPFETGSASGGGLGLLQATTTATNGQLAYGCRAEESFESAQSWRLADPVLRSVDTGTPENPDWAARAVLYNGPIDEKIDIVFFHDDDEYTSFQQEAFLEDVYNLVNDGMWSIAWFVENQWAFNIWIATADTANASPEPGPPPDGQSQPSCQRRNADEIRNIFNTDYKFRDAGAIVHSSQCRDNANVPRTFTIEADSGTTLAHEMGHKPFGMADEYCRPAMGGSICDGGHFQNNPFANLYREEGGCRDNAFERPYEPDDCRVLNGANGFDWFLGEIAYNNFPLSLQTPDLMQQTGGRESPPGSGIIVGGAIQVGLTEIDRMNWLVEQCIAGDC